MRCRQRLFHWLQCTKRGDLYVMRNNTDGNYEGVTHFILVEQPNGTYTLNANPTSAQISQFNLNTPAAIAYELADINLDGAMDMVLLDSGNIASGIVYAATSSQSAPIGYKHIDEEFIEFFADLYEGILDLDYFYNTALQNGWGTWEQVGPYIFSYWDSAILHLSGQTFVPVDLPPPSEPIPFYSNAADAYNPNVQPFWCAINGQGGYRWWNGVWEVLGWYREAVFVPDYSSFSQDAMLLSNAFKSYYETETESTSVQSVIYQVLGEYIGAVFGGYAHNESTARATVFRIWRLLGPVIYQEPEPPLFRTRLDIVYTAVPIAGASHAWLLATDSTGAQYATRGGPEGWISVTKPFGHIEAWALPPLDPNFPDNPTLNQATFIQEVGFISIDIHNVIPSYSVANILNSFRDRTNNAEIVYNPFVRNSNSYAFQAVEELGQLRPTPLLWAPGWSTVLSVP